MSGEKAEDDKSIGGVSGVKQLTTRPFSKMMAPSPRGVSRERNPVFWLKATTWTMSRRGRSSSRPFRLIGLRSHLSRRSLTPGVRFIPPTTYPMAPGVEAT